MRMRPVVLMAAIGLLAVASAPRTHSDLAADVVATCASCHECENPEYIGQGFGGAEVQWVGSWFCPNGFKASCDEMSPGNCEGGGTSLAPSLENAIGDGDVEKVLDVLHSQRDAIFTASRGAVQLLGCNGDVVMQFPITQSLVEALEAADV